MKLGALLFSLALTTLAPALASARGPYVVLRDDGTFAQPLGGPAIVREKIIPLYVSTGAPMPDIISLWTSFPMGGNPLGTFYTPVANDVRGIGLERYYGGNGLFRYATAPLRSILLHNDVTKLAQRARFQNSPLEGFAEYIFLLELSHAWGPGLKLDASDSLIGSPFHWSFFLDSAGPGGGNPWRDNGDQTFTVQGQSPKTLRYSMLDLYTMGFAAPSEVPPFGVLESVTVPQDVLDPFTQRPFSKASFPWWGDAPFTVAAERRTVTIENVVAANGPRTPDAAHSPKTLSVGVVLLVGANQTDDQVAAAERAIDPVARSIAAAFHDATQKRGTLNVVTPATNEPSQPVEETEGEAASALGSNTPSRGSDTRAERSGCAVAPSCSTNALWLAFGALFLFLRRRKTK